MNPIGSAYRPAESHPPANPIASMHVSLLFIRIESSYTGTVITVFKPALLSKQRARPCQIGFIFWLHGLPSRKKMQDSQQNWIIGNTFEQNTISSTSAVFSYVEFRNNIEAGKFVDDAPLVVVLSTSVLDRILFQVLLRIRGERSQR
jgi:hypothetical protein